MFWNIFVIILLVFSALIPIMIWGYLFSYFDWNDFNRKRFFLWIFAWSISVFPVLYLWDIIDELWLNVLNIFQKVYDINNFLDIWNIFISLFLILILLSLTPFLINLSKMSKNTFNLILKNFLIFTLFLVWFSVLFFLIKYFFSIFSTFDFEISTYPEFWKIAFNSFLLVIFYYLLIWFLEELSKFLSFNNSKNFLITSPKQWVLFAIFTALWFAFLENILYFYSMFQNYSFWKEFLWVYFSRNIFSVFMHVICSSLFAYFFSVWYLKFTSNFKYIKMLFLGAFLAIFFHSIFDIFLTLDFTAIIFLYLIWWYFYISYIFYKQ